MTGLTFKPTRVTKRQRNNLKWLQRNKTRHGGRNPSLAERSLRDGDGIVVAGVKYKGRNPLYSFHQGSPLEPVQWFKAELGIPFVRCS